MRSPHAHADIVSISVDEALKIDGVVGILTGADVVAAGFGRAFCIPGLANANGTPLVVSDWLPIAHKRVRAEWTQRLQRVS